MSSCRRWLCRDCGNGCLLGSLHPQRSIGKNVQGSLVVAAADIFSGFAQCLWLVLDRVVTSLFLHVYISALSIVPANKEDQAKYV